MERKMKQNEITQLFVNLFLENMPSVYFGKLFSLCTKQEIEVALGNFVG